MSTHCSCHCLVITSLVITSPVAVKVKVGHTHKNGQQWQVREGMFVKKNSVDHNRKGIENLSMANAVKEKVIHLDQLVFLLIFLCYRM